MSQTWLWIGVISMALGSAFFGFGVHNARDEQWKKLYLLNFFICLIAAALYLTMALGQGKSTIDGRPTFWVRYITWSLSTPLLVLDLAFLGRSSLPLTVSLVGVDIFMIATGLVAALSPDPINYIWYIVSTVAYLAIAYLLIGPYREEAEQKRPRTRKNFNKLVTVHLILWTAYPIVWILAPSGIDAITPDFETMFYTLLDIAAKVGFGFLALNTFSKLQRSEEVNRDREVEPSLHS